MTKGRCIMVGTEEVQALTGLCGDTIRGAAARGEIPGAVRIGGKWLFNREKLEAFLKGEHPPKPE